MNEKEILAALMTGSTDVEFIVRAVNTHHDLITALRVILDSGLDGYTAKAARKVLAKAEGRAF